MAIDPKVIFAPDPKIRLKPIALAEPYSDGYSDPHGMLRKPDLIEIRQFESLNYDLLILRTQLSQFVEKKNFYFYFILASR